MLHQHMAVSLTIFIHFIHPPLNYCILYDAGESDVESTQADTYEFLGELCYLNQDCDAPFAIENANYEAVQMRYNIIFIVYNYATFH